MRLGESIAYAFSFLKLEVQREEVKSGSWLIFYFLV